MLRAIPTRYAGINFRSRIEARWALLFDRLGVEWQYEAEGFQLSHEWYLPDFWFPEWRSFAEVKGAMAQFTPKIVTTCRELVAQMDVPLLLLDAIRVLDPTVPVLLPGEPCGHECHRCDLAASWAHGHLWHEWGREEATTLEIRCGAMFGQPWQAAASAALKERFAYQGRA